MLRSIIRGARQIIHVIFVRHKLSRHRVDDSRPEVREVDELLSVGDSKSQVNEVDALLSVGSSRSQVHEVDELLKEKVYKLL